MKFLFLNFLFLSVLLQAQEYELGRGIQLHEKLSVGAYFSIDYAKGESIDKARLDDVAVLAYGNLTSNFSYLLELESAPTHVENYNDNTSETDLNFHYERVYGDYIYSDMFAFRLGKFITPIGYWNLEPINVLRDTTSNPLYSSFLFPKFVTGINLNGYVNENDTLKYNLFLQITDDIDKDYINIRNDFFVGGSLEYELSYELSIGGTIGYFETLDTLTQDTLTQKNVSLVQMNAKYDNYPYVLQTEFAYTDVKNTTTSTTAYQVGGYLQGMYNFTPEHAVVGRYEYYDNTQLLAQELKQNIGIIGYSYRPVYAISIKGEYQFNSIDVLSKAMISFSVLF